MVIHVWSKPRDTHDERAGAADQTEVRASAPGHCTSGALTEPSADSGWASPSACKTVPLGVNPFGGGDLACL